MLAQPCKRVGSRGRNQPSRGSVPCSSMLRCFAAVDTWTHHIATDPSVRNAGGRESIASQVEPPRTDFIKPGRVSWPSFAG